MRIFTLVVGLLPLSGFAHAEGLALQATPLECAALESLVVYGLIDGGEGGDTSELTALLDQADGPTCLAELTAYGFGTGLLNADCYTAFGALVQNGLPEDMQDQIPDFIGTILAPVSDATCQEMAFDLTAGQ